MAQVINEEALLVKRTAGWVKLEQLSKRANAGSSLLTGPEVVEFVRLYRQTSADLAFLQTHSSNQEVVNYLNIIVTDAYGVLYRAPRKSFWRGLVDLVALAAQTTRRRAIFIGAATAIFVLAAVATFGLMSVNSRFHDYFVSEQEEALFSRWKEGRFDPRSSGEGVLATAMYAGHNPRVGILTNAASAASFGLFTVYIVSKTGIQLGALSQEMASVGKLDFLVTSLAPHGVSEIGGMLVSAGAGFVMAWALICPGRRTRGEALRVASKDALILMVLSLVMIFAAAPIEGFFSFNPLVPQWLKGVVAILAFAAWGAYLIGYGRDFEAPKDPQAKTTYLPA